MSYFEIVLMILTSVTFILVMLCIYYFLSEKNRKFLWLISIILLIFSKISFNYGSNIFLERKTNESIELLEEYLYEEYPSDKWHIEKMGTIGQEKKIILHVVFEKEPQIDYVYHINGVNIKQVSYHWNVENVDIKDFSPSYLE